MLDEFIKTLEDQFKLTLDDANKIIKHFHSEMNRGLKGNASSLKMLPAYVNRATGKEKGRYLALDFGGTNFRVLGVILDGKGRAHEEHVGKYIIPKAVMHGTGTQLFNFIAQSIQKFMLSYNVGLKKYAKLGFTFSFPMNQTDIAKGVLIQWTKGFNATGVVGKNVVKMLSDSLNRYCMEEIHITALANDTVGTLATQSYKDQKCDMGVIFGTGTNGCYIEKVKNIKILKGDFGKHDHMIINIEWGDFNKLPQNDYDLKLDKATNNPKRQVMEKMISGMYLGELTRLVLTEMIKKKLIFAGCKVKFSKGDFITRHMSFIESDTSDELLKIQGYLEGVGIHDNTVEERKLLKKICGIISTRAARISGTAISAVVSRMDPELKYKHTVAIDGTLFERYPGFRRRITGILQEFHGKNAKNIKMIRTKDGSGIGAAIVSAVAASKH